MRIIDPVTKKETDSTSLLLVDKLMQARKDKSVFDVIAIIIDYWKTINADKYDSFIFQMQETRKTRANDTASTKDKTQRYLLDIPEQIIRFIRVMYNSDELKMDKRFFRSFAKRFPEFKVAQKI
jgi:hypothetical protein